MKEKEWFVKWARGMLFVSVLLGVFLVVVGQSDGIPLFNLWVDIIVGIFTVWGLKWAASEFAELTIKPRIQLLLGASDQRAIRLTEGDKQISPLKDLTVSMPGLGRMSDPPPFSHVRDAPHLLLSLYLANETSRAGRHVRIVIRTGATPAPTLYQFGPGPYIKDRNRISKTVGPSDFCTISAQFSEDLVVYQDFVYIGNLIIEWSDHAIGDELPASIEFDYDIHTLDGSSHGKKTFSIDWKT